MHDGTLPTLPLHHARRYDGGVISAWPSPKGKFAFFALKQDIFSLIFI